jgi:hypothetical protein
MVWRRSGVAEERKTRCIRRSRVYLVTMSRESPYDNYLILATKYVRGYIVEGNKLITRSGIAEAE